MLFPIAYNTPHAATPPKNHSQPLPDCDVSAGAEFEFAGELVWSIVAVKIGASGVAGVGVSAGAGGVWSLTGVCTAGSEIGVSTG